MHASVPSFIYTKYFCKIFNNDLNRYFCIPLIAIWIAPKFARHNDVGILVSLQQLLVFSRKAILTLKD